MYFELIASQVSRSEEMNHLVAADFLLDPTQPGTCLVAQSENWYFVLYVPGIYGGHL